MNQLLPTLVLLSLNISLFAQISWTELEPHNTERTQIETVTSEGDIIGTLNYPPMLIISDNQGDTWRILYQGDLLQEIPDNILFKEDQNGQLYVALKHILYKVDRENSSLISTGIIDDPWNQIRDFEFAANGNVLLGNDRHLKLFSENGQLITKKEWIVTFCAFTPNYSQNDNHCLGIVTFSGLTWQIIIDPDLEEINYQRIFSHSPRWVSPGSVYKQDGRLFVDDNYSDTIGIWSEFVLGDDKNRRTKSIALGNGKIQLLSNLGNFESLDNGETFSPILSDDLRWIAQDLWYHENAGVYVSYNWSSSLSLISTNSNSIKDLNLDVGNPFSYSIEVASENSLFLKCDVFYKQTSQKEYWHSLDIPWPCTNAYASLPNGRIISNYCISVDEGETWAEHDTTNWTPLRYGPIIKDNHIFSFSRNSIAVSTDSGLSNTIYAQCSSSWCSPDIYSSDTEFGIGHVYTKGDNQSVKKRNFNGEILQKIDPPFGNYINIDFATSFKDSHLYILYKDFLGQFYIGRTFDQAESFDYVELDFSTELDEPSLKTDHLGNIYILEDKKLFISHDKAHSWLDISPQFPMLHTINNIEVGWDNHVYLATEGTPVLKSAQPLSMLTSVDETFENDNSVEVYPNPASNNIFISTERHFEYFQLVDIQGIVLLEGILTDNQIDVANLPLGTYFLRLKAGDNIAVERVTIY